MGRKPREIIKNGTYHIAVRVNEHHRWFEKDDVCKLYLATLFREKVKNKFKVYSFCLMPTHSHLILQSNDEVAAIHTVMQQMNGIFAKKFHELYGTRGHFWRARYFSRPLRTENEMLGALCYIANNPVKAHLVSDPLAHTYNSIRILQDRAVFRQLLSDLPPNIKQIMTEQYKISSINST